MSSPSSKFPATSIGRSGGSSRLFANPRAPSPSPSDPLTQVDTTTVGYVPYTPRTRPTTTSVLKAPEKERDAHTILADAGVIIEKNSAGVQILEALISAAGDEWNTIRKEVKGKGKGKGKALLLLPTCTATTTPNAKDHVAYIDDDRVVTTLSGLRGVLRDDEGLVFAYSPGANALWPTYPTTHTDPTLITLSLPASSPASATTVTSTPPPIHTNSRIGNPFASLFAGKGDAPKLQIPSLSTAALEDLQISALLLARPISSSEISESVTLTVHTLLAGDHPEWLVSYINEFAVTAGLMPFTETAAAADDVEELMRKFLEGVTEQIASRRQDHDGEDDHSLLIRASETLSTVFYDKFFKVGPHDVSLAARITELSSVGLGLGELDVVFESEATDTDAKLEELVTRIGDVLNKLDSIYTPKGKASVMVDVHKAIVDGLQTLPPLRLKTDAEIEAETKLLQAVDVPTDTGRDIPLIVEPTSGKEKEEGDEPKAKPITVSLDVLFPILVYAIVKLNPRKLTSHLVFVQACGCGLSGEESYCLVNLMAVVEFLQGAITPSASPASTTTSLAPPSPIRPTPGALSLRDSATKLMDSVNVPGLGMLKGFLPNTSGTLTQSLDVSPAWNLNRVAMLRRDSVLSVKSMFGGKDDEKEKEKEMVVTSSRPSSRVSARKSIYATSDDDESDGGDDDEQDDEDEASEEEEEEENGDQPKFDTRSIRSFESMMKDGKKGKGKRGKRKTLGERLSGITGRSARQQPPPSRRFLDVDVDDLTMRDVRDLLNEYKRVVGMLEEVAGTA